MPELPEVEVLVRHLDPVVRGKTIRGVQVRRPRVLRPTTVRSLTRNLIGAKLTSVIRRGKYLLFAIEPRASKGPRLLVGHLGMTGRMYLLPAGQNLPKHAAVVFDLGAERFVFEDTRYFGRLTLDTSILNTLGPEPLGNQFNPTKFAADLARSTQPIKVKLLDQSIVAGVGNIYASEALFRAGISPRTPCHRLSPKLVRRLWRSIRATLEQAIAFGSTVPLNYSGVGDTSRLFYYGIQAEEPALYQERLKVYDRNREPCLKCHKPIRRIVQAGRSTFYCPDCQPTENVPRGSRAGGPVKTKPASKRPPTVKRLSDRNPVR